MNVVNLALYGLTPLCDITNGCSHRLNKDLYPHPIAAGRFLTGLNLSTTGQQDSALLLVVKSACISRHYNNALLAKYGPACTNRWASVW